MTVQRIDETQHVNTRDPASGEGDAAGGGP